MVRVLQLLLCAGFVVGAAGCGRPQLASRPLTAEETFWGQNVKLWYPGWSVPYRSPALATPAQVPAKAAKTGPARPEASPASPAAKAPAAGRPATPEIEIVPATTPAPGATRR